LSVVKLVRNDRTSIAVIASGPMDNWPHWPSKEYTIRAKNPVYRPIVGGRPASRLRAKAKSGDQRTDNGRQDNGKVPVGESLRYYHGASGQA
jgi:hypothetical protein